MHERYLKIWSDPKRKEDIKSRNALWFKKNPDQARALNRAYRERNRIALRARQREERKRKDQRLRQKAINMYGRKCVWCGDDNSEHLQFDHTQGNGNKHRRGEGISSAGCLYKWLEKNNYPKDLIQLLCANCHNAKSHYGRTAPVYEDVLALVGAC